MSVARANVVLFHGPPFSGRTLYYKQHLSKDYVRVDPDQIYRQYPALTVRQLINKYILSPLKQGKKVLIDDAFQTLTKRSSYISLIKKKISSVNCVCYQFTPENGSDQLYWAQEYCIAQLALASDSEGLEHRTSIQIDGWLTQAEPPKIDEGFSHIKEIKTQLMVENEYMLEVPGLLIQWEGLVQLKTDDPELVPGIQNVLEFWYKVNPCGRIIVIADGISSPGVTSSERSHQILHLMTELVKQLTECPVYVLMLSPAVLINDFSEPPKPGAMALIQKLHCINLYHPGTMYLYHSSTHMKMAQNTGIKHVKASRVFGHPSLAKSSHATTQCKVPSMLENLKVVQSCNVGVDGAMIPMYEELLKADKCFVVWKLAAGRTLFAFVKDTDVLIRYQDTYAKNATLTSMNEPSQILSLAFHSSTQSTQARNNQSLLKYTSQHHLLDQSTSSRPRELPKWMIPGAVTKIYKGKIKQKTPTSVGKHTVTSSKKPSRGRRSRTACLPSTQASKLVLTGDEIKTSSKKKSDLDDNDGEYEDKPQKKLPRAKKPAADLFAEMLDDLVPDDDDNTTENNMTDNDRSDMRVSETDLSGISQKKSRNVPNVTIIDSFVRNTSSCAAESTECMQLDSDGILDDLLFDKDFSTLTTDRKWKTVEKDASFSWKATRNVQSDSDDFLDDLLLDKANRTKRRKIPKKDVSFTRKTARCIHSDSDDVLSDLFSDDANPVKQRKAAKKYSAFTRKSGIIQSDSDDALDDMILAKDNNILKIQRTSNTSHRVSRNILSDSENILDDLLSDKNDGTSTKQRKTREKDSSFTREVTSAIECDSDNVLDDIFSNKASQTKVRPQRLKTSHKATVVPDSFVSESLSKGLKTSKDLSSNLQSSTAIIIDDSLVPNTDSFSRMHKHWKSHPGNSRGGINVVPDSFVPETVTSVPETVLSERSSHRDQSLETRMLSISNKDGSKSRSVHKPIISTDITHKDDDDFSLLDGLI